MYTQAPAPLGILKLFFNSWTKVVVILAKSTTLKPTLIISLLFKSPSSVQNAKVSLPPLLIDWNYLLNLYFFQSTSPSPKYIQKTEISTLYPPARLAANSNDAKPFCTVKSTYLWKEKNKYFLLLC